ncbi:putative dual specificity protein phosphatase [Cucumis melo var. makuwa]|uniref:Putative dual specificity protein phosphatase n=1 Tax=Cucumis melo var. makuwa TaxID=1194695 RepID=A0A5D3BU03_CUCMM|nr:putative dual specificity protein phosphatase [Cucumis melo var. makuwa]
MDALTLFSPSSSSSSFSSSIHSSLKSHNNLFLLRNGSRSFSDFPNVCSSFPTLNLPTRFSRKSIILAAKKTNAKPNKDDGHRSLPKPDESIGFFPEAVLLKEKKVAEDGQFLPEFADAEEEKLYEYLNLQLESESKVEQMRHYEVVFLIHEKNAEEVESVIEKVQGFLREKKGKVWRLSDWGMRRLAYKIKKAKYAHYILMNFELEAKWINEFKSMLDMDERVIRHLVIKRDTAITEDCPPPPEFHTLRAGVDDDDDNEEDDMDDYNSADEMDWDDEDELDDYDDGFDDGIIIVDSDNDDTSKIEVVVSFMALALKLAMNALS